MVQTSLSGSSIKSAQEPEKGTSLPTKKGATEIFLSTSRESSKSSKKRESGVSAVLIEKEATRAC